MQLPDNPADCQLPCVPNIAQGFGKVPPESLARRLRLLARRNLDFQMIRALKTKSDRFIEQVLEFLRLNRTKSTAKAAAPTWALKPGDLVRVRSLEEIQGTLNHWGILKGCMFMPNEMSPYCGTTQRVLKRVERFVDERDYRVKTCHGIVFLEGAICQGTTDYGRCDRSCFFFWREEWLEKIGDAPPPTFAPSSGSNPDHECRP